MLKNTVSSTIAFLSVATMLVTSYPTGSYILVRYLPTGHIGEQEIVTELVFNDQLVCSWNLGENQPWDRGKNYLYFVPRDDNCPGLDPRNFVKWNVLDNFGEVYFESKKILEIPVWTMDATGKYSLR